jgi:hypothetical protein
MKEGFVITTTTWSDVRNFAVIHAHLHYLADQPHNVALIVGAVRPPGPLHFVQGYCKVRSVQRRTEVPLGLHSVSLAGTLFVTFRVPFGHQPDASASGATLQQP